MRYEYDPLKDINTENWLIRATEGILVNNSSNLYEALTPMIEEIYQKYGPNRQNKMPYEIVIFFGDLFALFNKVLKRNIFGSFDYEISSYDSPGEIVFSIRDESGYFIDHMYIKIGDK